MKNYIAYYRVSTKQQGFSGLGLDAQKEIVKRFCSDGIILLEFQDIESGKNNNRPELKKALDAVKKVNGILVIAKLDRLSRNLTFISQLRDSEIEFICCDMPNANKLTIGMMAVIAQEEREMISKRTKDALKAKKDRGISLGNPSNILNKDEDGNLIAVKNRIESVKKKCEDRDAVAKSIAEKMEKSGSTLKEICDELNRLGIKTARSKEFKIETVRRLLGRKNWKIPDFEYVNI